VRPADDEQFAADLSRLLNHVDECVAQFDQAAASVSKVQSFDGSAWIMLRELGRAGARVYNATSAVQKRLERLHRNGQRLGLE
jgi:hypothetical protein